MEMSHWHIISPCSGQIQLCSIAITGVPMAIEFSRITTLSPVKANPIQSFHKWAVILHHNTIHQGWVAVVLKIEFQKFRTVWRLLAMECRSWRHHLRIWQRQANEQLNFGDLTMMDEELATFGMHHHSRSQFSGVTPALFSTQYYWELIIIFVCASSLACSRSVCHLTVTKF